MAKKKTNAEYMTDTFMSAINVDALIKALEDGKLSPSVTFSATSNRAWQGFQPCLARSQVEHA